MPLSTDSWWAKRTFVVNLTFALVMGVLMLWLSFR
jgi:hypothetical protein